MGFTEEPLEGDGTPVREFAFWLRDLRRRSGLTYAQMSRRSHYGTSTLQEATTGQRLPTLRVVLAFVAACDGDEEAWREYWARVSRVLDPATVGQPVTPPWLEAGTPSATAGAPIGEPAGWFIASFAALVNVDEDPVEVIERRVIIAAVDGLSEVVTSITVPRHPAAPGLATGLETELIDGGTLEARQRPFESYFTNVIVLPKPLRSGERHQFTLRLRIPPGQRMTPHFLHVPYRRSDNFDLRVRFAASRLPSAVWLLDGAPPALLYQCEPEVPALVPDERGEVRATFRDMRPGLGYGVRWREFDQEPTGS